MIISLENISKYYNGECILNNISLTIENKDKIGLVGINGCGKSTLLKIITGTEIPDTQPEPNTPRINKNKNTRIGFLAQNSGLNGDATVIDEMKSAFAELLSVSERLEQMRNNLTAENEGEYSKMTAYFEANDGYLIDVKINRVLHGMGFSPDTHSRIVSTLSGGERTRLALAKLLLENPDLLILDEPTNHLDFDTVMWLEDYLREYKKALLIVSHDRYFLDKLVTSVCEIERGTLRRFKGNYTSFVMQKQSYIEHQMKEYQSYNEEVTKLKDYIARNLTRASTSNMAKSRVKQLEKLESNPVLRPVTHEKSAKIKFEYAREPVKELLTVKNVDLTVTNETDGIASNITLVPSLSFEVRRGERLAIVGSNGSGKSTLLKVLQKKHPHLHGSVEWGDNLKIAYFEQTNTEIFDDNDTVMNAVHKLYPKMTELAVRKLLGSVRLTGDDVFKKVGSLSGGERSKLRFAVLTLERGNLLILDEPTNHLDIATCEVLEAALSEYTGTIIFVSHDRYLLNRLATRILEIVPDEVRDYKAGFAEFMEVKRAKNESMSVSTKAEKTESPAKPEQSEQAEKTNRYLTKEQKALKAQRRVKLKQLENEIAELEERISALQSDMETPEIFADHQLLQEKCALYEECKTRLSHVTDEWLEMSENE